MGRKEQLRQEQRQTKQTQLETVQARRFTRVQLLRFFLLFFLFAGLLFALAYFWTGGMEALEGWTAGVTAFLLSLFGYPASASGALCSVGPLVIQIIPECTGVFEIIVFSSVLLAYPAPWRKKLLGILAGLVILTFLNLLRLLILGIIGFSNQELMEWIHLYLWQLTLIAFVVGLFFAWLAWIQPRKATPLLPNSPDAP
jgi:exosortase H (IPTLxxWG-CTERM-specific)